MTCERPIEAYLLCPGLVSLWRARGDEPRAPSREACHRRDRSEEDVMGQPRHTMLREAVGLLRPFWPAITFANCMGSVGGGDHLASGDYQRIA